MSHFDDDDAPPHHTEDPNQKKRGDGAKGLLPEGLRKALQSGAAALFASDEGGKRPLGELRLPKEAMQFLYQQAERGRKDLFRMATREMRRVLNTMDMPGELRRALVGVKLKVKAEISFEESETSTSMRTAVTQATRTGEPSAEGAATEDPTGAAVKRSRKRPRV